MDIYERHFRLKSSDVDKDRRLRTSVLFSMLQEAAIAHTEELGMGREKTLDRGLLWIVTLQRAEIERMPLYDENVVLRSWPGRTMHLLFPRYFSLETEAGEPLLKASSIWSLIDARTRAIVFPEKHGIEIEGVTTGDEIALPSAPRPLSQAAGASSNTTNGPSDGTAPQLCTAERSFTVPYSFVDLNGHMNNTRYFDLAEDMIFELNARSTADQPVGKAAAADQSVGKAAAADQSAAKASAASADQPAAKAPAPKLICSEFSREVRLGEAITISLSSGAGKHFILGTAADGKPCFKLRIETA